jgi:hypothetical protein
MKFLSLRGSRGRIKWTAESARWYNWIKLGYLASSTIAISNDCNSDRTAWSCFCKSGILFHFASTRIDRWMCQPIY